MDKTLGTAIREFLQAADELQKAHMFKEYHLEYMDSERKALITATIAILQTLT